MKKNKLLWFFIALILSVLTIITVFKNSGLSFVEFTQNIKESSAPWLIAAICCTILYIILEGEALVQILKGLGLPAHHHRGFLYSAADIYFSSITPSASGGQPASVDFMMKDGLPGPAVTVSLIVNVTMYTLSIITLGLFTLIVRPGYFDDFSIPGEIAIIFGIVIMVLLVAGFLILLKNQKILMRFGKVVISILQKLHLRREAVKLENKLESLIANYNECVDLIAGKKAMLIKVYLLNLFQRAAQIMVTVCSYFALHGDIDNGLNIFAIQTYVVLGSNFIPVPGAIGISEYLMFFGYQLFMDEASTYNVAILSRGISFYTCIIISIITVILGYIQIKLKARLKSK